MPHLRYLREKTPTKYDARSLSTHADPNIHRADGRLAASYQHILAQAYALPADTTLAPCQSMLAQIYGHHRPADCSRVRVRGLGDDLGWVFDRSISTCIAEKYVGYNALGTACGTLQVGRYTAEPPPNRPE